MSRSARGTRIRIGITIGDPSGIGPEVTFAALRALRSRKVEYIVYTDASLVDESHARCVVVSSLHAKYRLAGKPTRQGGEAQLDYIDKAIDALRHGHIDALCTAPVSKEQIRRTGVNFVGHTEYLADSFDCRTMMLMDGPLFKVALATNHLPLAQVPRAITKKHLSQQIADLNAGFQPLLGRMPTIAVLGLNPHCGEGGTLGKEETDIIAPTVARMKRQGLRCEGPFAADGYFSKSRPQHDVVLAMYHDQGLIPVKALDSARTVNVTLGLPFVRTSPDHGVAYDLAGRGQADYSPMLNALKRTTELALGGGARTK